MICQTSIKCWPAEYHSQSAIEAALKLRQDLGGDTSAVESVLVESHDAAVDIIGSRARKMAAEESGDRGSQSALHRGRRTGRW